MVLNVGQQRAKKSKNVSERRKLRWMNEHKIKAPVTKVDQIEDSPIKSGRGRPKNFRKNH